MAEAARSGRRNDGAGPAASPAAYDLDLPAITLDMADDGPTVFEMPTTPFPLTVKLMRLQRLEQ
jgi:hypothetical protein